MGREITKKDFGPDVPGQPDDAAVMKLNRAWVDYILEAEVQQIKKRLKMALAASGQESHYWPGAARWVGEERLHFLALGRCSVRSTHVDCQKLK